MTIPGRGDLSPRRRHGGYGRRERRWPRVLLVLVIIGALGAGGYYGWHRWRDKSTSTAALAPCPTSTLESSLPPPPAPVRPVLVLNGSLKPGLAAVVARQLHRRFHIPIRRVGNAARFTRGPSLVRYPARLRRDAFLVAAAVLPVPSLIADNSLRRVELDIGTRYRRIASSRERAIAYRAALVKASLLASPTPSPSPSPCSSS